jgi:hypothetical protein
VVRNTAQVFSYWFGIRKSILQMKNLIQMEKVVALICVAGEDASPFPQVGLKNAAIFVHGPQQVYVVKCLV